MMAAYQPTPGGMHPGIASHGHPAMSGGQPMNPAQMQQMGHPGAVTPGPHVTQAGAMMAMQPGANAMGGQHPAGQMVGMPGQMGAQSMAGVAPNAHAMSHLTPQTSLQQQQQQHLMQQHLQNNPQMMMHQQNLIQQQRMLQRANGMNGIQQSVHNLTPQQMQQLQQNGQGAAHPQGVQLPQHLQQQLQVARMQQQQQVMAQNQHMQQLAMQQANSQQSNQGGQSTAQSQQAAQAQHLSQPMRPQSRAANANDQGQGTPQQNAHREAQQAQQAQQQQAQQQNAAASQAQANPQPTQHQAQQSQQAINMQMMQRRQQMIQQQQSAVMQQRAQAQQAQQLQQQSGGGAFILKAIQFADNLGQFGAENGKDITQWYSFVDKHFAPEGRFMHSFQFDDGKQKIFEIPRGTIARYFQTYFDSNASYIRLHLEHVRETPVHSNRHQVSFSNATLTVAYPNGARAELHGNVKMLFAPGSDVIELMELHTERTEEHVNRSDIERLLSTWSPSMSSKASPKALKKNLPKAQQKMQSQFEGLTIDHFPRTPKAKLGTSERVQSFLEISETMTIMVDLIGFAQDKKIRPDQAVDALNLQYETQGGPNGQLGNPQINLPVNGVLPAGNRTPSMGHMQMTNAQGQFVSPSVSHLNLPMQNGISGMNGSPHIANNMGLNPNLNMPHSHTPSPHQSNMAAPQMMPQHSQQGTNSSAASANTSPNVNNKRRRSTVKLEGDDGGPDGAQGNNRVKPSPRMPKKAKPGAG